MSGEVLQLAQSYQLEFAKCDSNQKYHYAALRLAQRLASLTLTSFKKGAETAQDVLLMLDPSVHTMVYAYALFARIATAPSTSTASDSFRPGGNIWKLICHFLENADPVQLRYVGEQWSHIVDFVASMARLAGTPEAAIEPILSALYRLDPNTGTFTMAHLCFVQLCVETRNYAAAEPILANYIHAVNPSIPDLVESLEYSAPAEDHDSSAEYIKAGSGHAGKVTIQAVQEYYLLGTTAYLGLRKFKKARDFVEHVLVMPYSNGAANGFLIEAYKKWLLLSCLVDGVVPPLPRSTNNAAMRAVKAVSKAYEALADAFKNRGNVRKLRAMINAGRDTWLEDGNYGLVNELLDGQYRIFISQLSQTYSAIPISKISSWDATLESDELAGYLEKLIREGYINAKLETSSSKPEMGVVLRFFMDAREGPQAKSEKQQQQALVEQTQRTQKLAQQVQSAHYRVGVQDEYVEYVVRQNKKAAATAGDPMDLGQYEDVEVAGAAMDAHDEDLMGD
ncbi:uncharacterized protein EI97DRAFT_435553 [Westerdykella ornata]|uniref:COP9 signalosome complex subunit 3 N-terminal helical repeats domain-containing protein n=1 Tax=Westerdykella ornata TaxID=318751 RepID=A0A6A6JCB3_WESOR|nr:uncharacterized protein EI97DRAFT_435553 [Westerdykella ornata]KAF2273907.1 hypothetical protein EI97DRAFT_435553 [Westerdykella ornata]